MYKNNFVATIKSNGKILREKKGCVMLPFGSEYSVLLKNLDSRNAVMKLSIDGDDVLDGHRVIVPGDSTIELKGRMKEEKVRHRFKFIKKTEKISNYRGDRPDDGLVRVEYWFEKSTVSWCSPNYPLKYKHYITGDWFTTSDYYDNLHDFDGSTGRFDPNSVRQSITGSITSNPVMSNYSYTSGPIGDDGITVQGSKVRQDFVYEQTSPLEEQSHVIVLQLRGITDKGTKISMPVTVKTKFRCPTCGKKSKSSARWCSSCGTNLEI
jgi:hypothetical protein